MKTIACFLVCVSLTLAQTITPIAGTDVPKDSRVVINNNFNALSTGKLGVPAAYSNSKTYLIGDSVIAGGITYTSLQTPNLNNTPSSSPTYWMVFASTVAGPAGTQGQKGDKGDTGNTGATGPAPTCAAGNVYAGPASGAAGTAACRVLTVADLPSSGIPASSITGNLNIDLAITDGPLSIKTDCNTIYNTGSGFTCPGSSTPSLTSAVSPSSRTVIQGDSVTYTQTLTSANLISSITPTLTITGGATGLTTTVSPATVSSTGGVATWTVAASSVATPGTYTLTFNASSGGTNAAAVTSSIIVSIPLTYVTSSLTDVGAPQTYSTSLLDFRTLDGVSGPGTDTTVAQSTRKNITTALISEPYCTGGSDNARYFNGQYGSYQNSSATFVWTDGTPVTSGTSGNTFICASGAKVVVPFTIANSSPHTIKIYYAEAYYTTATLNWTVHLADGSTADTVIADNINSGGSGPFKELTINVRTNGATTMTVSAPFSGAFQWGYKGTSYVN